MADLVDLKLGTDGDLDFGSNLDLSLISEEDLVRQSIQLELRTFRGEWFLDTTAGVPYFQEVFGPKKRELGEVDSIIKAAIMRVPEVNRILAYESSFADATRKFTVSAKVDTTYGPVDVEGVTI